MALLIYGWSLCALCNRVIEEGEQALSFPPLFFNQLAPQFVLNDGAAHRECLSRAPFAPAALSKLAEFERRRSEPKVCAVCGEEVASPDDYFTTGPLSDSPDDGLRPLDWLQAHLSCLPRWDALPRVVSLLQQVSRSAHWEGDALERLLERIPSRQ